MNLQTLTSGSIVMYGGKLWKVYETFLEKDYSPMQIQITDLSEENLKQVFLHNLNPVPITPELLTLLNPSHINFAFTYRWGRIRYIEARKTWELLLGDFEILYKKPELHLHDLQHFLRGIDGVDFEITLEQLKDYEPNI